MSNLIFGILMGIAIGVISGIGFFMLSLVYTGLGLSLEKSDKIRYWAKVVLLGVPIGVMLSGIIMVIDKRIIKDEWGEPLLAFWIAGIIVAMMSKGCSASLQKILSKEISETNTKDR